MNNLIHHAKLRNSVIYTCDALVFPFTGFATRRNFVPSFKTKNMTTTTKTKWKVDSNHSQINFKVKHLVISTVTGSFDKFEGMLETSNDDFTDADVTFSADVASINTNAPDRDAHLKSPDFFDVQNHPKLTFRSTEIKKNGTDKYLMRGDITIRGITRKIDLDVEFGGIMKDPWGNTKAGFEITGKLLRKEFGLNWNAVTEAGGIVVSDEVKIMCNVEIDRQ
jgi:polyisoprenoid-binding protein YceI